MKRTLLCFSIAMFATGLASAKGFSFDHHGGRSGPCPVAAPELDPSTFMSGMTLLSGCLVMLRVRRRS